MYPLKGSIYIPSNLTKILHLLPLPRPPLSQVWYGISLCDWASQSIYGLCMRLESFSLSMRVAGVMCVCDRRGCNIWIIHCWSKELKRKVIELLNHYCSLNTRWLSCSTVTALSQQLLLSQYQVHFINILSRSSLNKKLVSLSCSL